ncbi:MAG: IS3 family transposase [Acidimicrobiales bacterium]
MAASKKSQHPAQRRYPPEIRQRAVRMVLEPRKEDPADHGLISRVARQLDVGTESLRSWVKQADIDGGARPGATTAEQGELDELRRELKELRRANEILRAAAAFFGAAELDRRLDEVVAFIAAHLDLAGVEPICDVLQFARSTYYAAKTRLPSPRSLEDERLKPEVARVHASAYKGVFGAEKVWWQLEREGFDVGRDRVARLMREMGLSGVVRGGRRTFTTTPDEAAARPADLVKRNFTADAPNRLWVADLTYEWTMSGFAYTAFVTDVFSRYIVGWRVAITLAAEIALDALEMGIWARQGQSLKALVHHSDRGVQYLAIVYTTRLEEAGAAPSVGSKGDSFDNALAESINASYKAECADRLGPWRGVSELEIATAEWVEFHNKACLQGALDRGTPAEFEAAYWARRADGRG